MPPYAAVRRSCLGCRVDYWRICTLVEGVSGPIGMGENCEECIFEVKDRKVSGGSRNGGQ